MIKSLKHASVNWVDGMQISEMHYTAQERFIADSLRDVASFGINRFNYGLLPADGIDAENSIFDIYGTATNDVQLNIKKCHAITAAGYRIDIENLPVNINSLSGMVQGEMQQSYYVIITVNPFERIPTGDFDPEEIPPRHLFVKPHYHVQLVPVTAVNSDHTAGNYLVAGKVLFSNNIVSADASFIPPCTTIDSHPSLLKHYHDFIKYMALLQQYATAILRKSTHKSQHTVITRCITDICRVMLGQISNNYFQLRNTASQLPPVQLISTFANLAHSLYVCIDTMQDAEKEVTLNYCFEWSNIAPHVLLKSLSATVEINYNHYRIGDYMKTIRDMLLNVHSIWEKLSHLEYIGQQRENIIVKEEAITQTVKTNKGWSPFD